MEAFLHAHAVGLEKVLAVAAHNEKAAVRVPFKPPERLLNDILVVSARKAAVRRDNKIGVGPRRVVVFAVRAEVRAVDLARVPEDAADLVCEGIEKGRALSRSSFARRILVEAMRYIAFVTFCVLLTLSICSRISFMPDIKRLHLTSFALRRGFPARRPSPAPK